MARKKLQNTFQIYPENPSAEKRELLQEAKTKPQDRYNQVDKEQLGKMIQKVKSVDKISRHNQSWENIHEISGSDKKVYDQSFIKESS